MRGGRWLARFVASLVVSFIAAGCAYNAQQRASGWVLIETQHVRLRTSIPSDRAVEIAWELERIRKALLSVVLRCSAKGGADRLPVTVLPLSEFNDIAPEEAAGQYRRWAVTWLEEYEGEIIIPDDLGRDTRRVYQHELAHHLVASCLPRSPIWLTEGLAKLLETAVVDHGKVMIGLPPYILVEGKREPELSRAKGVQVVVLAPESLPPLDQVIAMRDDDFYLTRSHGSLQTESNYATAWALIHLLQFGADDLRARFMSFLTALSEMEGDPESLFTREFEDVHLQRRLTDYLRRGRFPTYRHAADKVEQSAVAIYPMTTGEAHLHWAWLWAGTADKKAFRWREREHLAAAKRDPAVRPRAHLLAAALSRLDRDLAGVEREVTEGLRAAPTDPALLHAYLDVLFARKADVSAAAQKLRLVARTADQICTLARVELAYGNVEKGLALARRGLIMKPSSWLCRKSVEAARKHVAR